jgi:hypothetical protein
MELKLSKGTRRNLSSLLAGDRMVRLETSSMNKSNYTVDELV